MSTTTGRDVLLPGAQCSDYLKKPPIRCSKFNRGGTKTNLLAHILEMPAPGRRLPVWLRLGGALPDGFFPDSPRGGHGEYFEPNVAPVGRWYFREDCHLR